MTLYRNTDERYGEPGPWEAASREELADGMQETFEQWAREIGTLARLETRHHQDPTTEVDEVAEIARMREEFIAALEEVES